jgi:L-ascorbate metabolism protein UlaG (beta-lactamase superfamily)
MDRIQWLGHSSFKISGQRIVYIDPYQIVPTSTHADIVLITHSHYDHCSPEDIMKVSDKHTTIVAPLDCVDKIPDREVTVIRPGDEMEVKGIRIHAVPAYNTHKHFHPKSKGWVGYVIKINGMNIYHAGDTDWIPEMGKLGHIDVALLPVGGNYTMGAEDAAHACDMINPEVAVPIHYGAIVGSMSDAVKFRDMVSCRVEFLEH